MIQRGLWARGDDKRLLQALHEGGYQHEWQVRLGQAWVGG